MTADNDTPRERASFLSRLMHKLTGAPPTRDELLQVFADERWETILEADEVTMLNGVLEVSQTQVREVMVPRSHMVVLERGAPKDEVLRQIMESGHSRFPVIGEDRDNVDGILLAKDVLAYFISGGDDEFDLGPFLRPATFIPESKRLNTLLKEFRVSRNHMAIVVDEYGGTSGLLTIEDVLEEIVGEIDDEHDPEEAAPVQKLGDNRFQVRALTRIEEFNEYFSVEYSDEEYDTVGGLVITELGRMPRRGESLSFGDFKFKIVQADRRRVHMLEVNREQSVVSDEQTGIG